MASPSEPPSLPAGASAPTAGALPPTKRGPPLALPLILAIALPLLYSLFAAPLIASAKNPDANIGRLKVLVCSFDTGDVDVAFTRFMSTMVGGTSLVTSNGALPITLPDFQIVSSASWSPESLRAAVRNSEAWGAVILNSGASAALLAAQAGPSSAAAYDPSGAMTIIWDEARNNLVSTARIAGPCKGLLTAFSEGMAKSTLAGFFAGGASTASFPLPADQELLAKLMGRPVSFSEENLFPFTIPALNTALLVGQILLCVFSLVIVNVTWGPLAAHPLIRGALPGASLALRRLTVILLLSCTVAAAFATIVAGLSQQDNLMRLAQTLAPGVTHGATGNAALSGSQWAAMWACQWIEMSVFALWLALPAVVFGSPAAAAALLAPLIIFNSISVNVDVSDAGYQFFYYAPFWHSSELIRNICFGTLASRVDMHVGVHWLWFLVELVLFFAAHIVVAMKAAAAAAVAASAGAATKV